MSILEREREVVAPKEVTEADVLERAADLLEEFGWCQYSLGKDEGGSFNLPRTGSQVRTIKRLQSAHAFCVNGALIHARADFRVTNQGEQSRLREIIGGGLTSTWNDKPGRTKAEVVTALRTAAEKARRS